MLKKGSETTYFNNASVRKVCHVEKKTKPLQKTLFNRSCKMVDFF